MGLVTPSPPAVRGERGLSSKHQPVLLDKPPPRTAPSWGLGLEGGLGVSPPPPGTLFVPRGGGGKGYDSQIVYGT